MPSDRDGRRHEWVVLAGETWDDWDERPVDHREELAAELAATRAVTWEQAAREAAQPEGRRRHPLRNWSRW